MVQILVKIANFQPPLTNIGGALWPLFLAAGLPASSGCQYYSCRSCRSRMFTPLPVMSVNGTIFWINHICSILLKLFQTCSSVIKLVQTYQNQLKLV